MAIVSGLRTPFAKQMIDFNAYKFNVLGWALAYGNTFVATGTKLITQMFIKA